MSDSPLLVADDGAVRTLTIHRPERLNALDSATIHALHMAFEAAAADPAVRVVVLTGSGPKAFVAGADIAEMSALSAVEARDFSLRGQRMMRFVEKMPKPVIAMVNGVAAGAGLSLALAADLRFAGKSARMTTALAKVGFSGDFGSHYFLHKLVGTAKARELYFTAEILNAEQIEKLGLANRVVDDANLDAETMAFARKLAAGPRVAWWHVKKNMKVAEEGTLSEALDSEAARMIRTGETEDHKEAARAFVEKRAPVFKGV